MKLIIGLGNPGLKYKKTRHNIGFMFVSEAAEYFGVKFSFKSGLEAELAEFIYKGEKVIFLKPSTFMNLSGRAVAKVLNYYKIEVEDLLVIYDDLDLPAGKIRIRDKGTSGGQKGIQSIIDTLSTNEIKRIRIGIDNNKQIDTATYVLGIPSGKDKDNLIDTVNKAGKMIECYLDLGFIELTNRYNHLGLEG